MKRRKMRKYRNVKKNSGVKLLGIIGIMISAVICGYLTARFVVAPLLGYDAEVLKLDFPSKMTTFFHQNEAKAVEPDNDTENTSTEKTDDGNTAENRKEETAKAEGYALQFGVFSSKSGAEILSNQLKKSNIETNIKKIDGQYKVLSKTFDTKDAAIDELETLQKKKNIDVFITVME